MKTIVAIIEKANDGGYGVWAEKDGVPVTGYGETEAEAKQEFLDMINYYIEDIKEANEPIPDWYDDDIQIEWKYDLSAFFQSFPFINASELAKTMNINPSLMRRYKTGQTKAGEKQKEQLNKEFKKIISKLELVCF